MKGKDIQYWLKPKVVGDFPNFLLTFNHIEYAIVSLKDVSALLMLNE